MKSSPHFSNKEKISKEQFLIAWTLARASVLDRSPNVYGIVRDANEAWKEIQKSKEAK